MTANLSCRKAAEAAGYRQYGIQPYCLYRNGCHHEGWLASLSLEAGGRAGEEKGLVRLADALVKKVHAVNRRKG